MKETRAILDAREELEEALRLMDEADTKIQGLAADVLEDERHFHKNTFKRAEANVAEAREKLERAIAIQKAREAVPPMGDDEPDDKAQAEGFSKRITIGVEPHTYRADNAYEVSFFRDVYYGQKGDTKAQERLRKHQMETRDVSTADPGAGVFVPPVYLGEMWAELPRESRPFANAIRNMPLPASGTSFTVPRLTTGVSVASQSGEATAPSETDADGTLLTVQVRTIAGQQDLSIQALERTDPGFDQIVFYDLRAAYDAELDRQLLAGTNSNGEHLGIRAVSNVNTSTYTAATPVVTGLHPKIYDLIQLIADGRKANADLIVMHPRRAAWIASALSSTFPLFQQGALMQAGGVQDGGFLQSFAGLRVVIDSNIATNRGAGTNEDEIYVVRSSDLILAEQPLRVRALEQTLANTLQVKLQVFAYSAFVSGRQPEAIGVLSGTGLAAPTF